MAPRSSFAPCSLFASGCSLPTGLGCYTSNKRDALKRRAALYPSHIFAQLVFAQLGGMLARRKQERHCAVPIASRPPRRGTTMSKIGTHTPETPRHAPAGR